MNHAIARMSFNRCATIAVAALVTILGAAPQAALAQAAPRRTAAGAAPAQQQLTTMAVVNGEEITRDELARECLLRYGDEVLETILKQQLIFQACQDRGVKITEQDVTDECQRMASKFGLTPDQLMSAFEERGEMTRADYRREIWKLLALRRLAAGRDIEVSQEEVRKAFESEYGPKVQVRMIAMKDKAQAEQVRQQAVANPKQFEQLARQHSEDANSASQGGAIPPVRKHLQDDQLEQAVFALEVGEISQVIPWADQFLIIKCERHLDETFIASQQLQLVESQISERIRDQKLREAAGELFQELMDQSRVEIVRGNAELEKKHPGVAAIVNGQPMPIHQLAEECLTRHGEEVLTGEIHRTLLTQELKRRNVQVQEADLEAEIERAAESFGYLKEDRTPDVEAWLQAITQEYSDSVELYVRVAVWPTVALKKLVSGRIEVTDEDMQKGFQSNYGERVEVLAIVLGDQRKAMEVWDMARNNPTDKFFGELASQYSIEPTSRENGGQVPPLRRHGGQPKLEEAAFQLQPGGATALSGVITIGDKHVILRCLGRTTPVVGPNEFASVKDELYRDLHEKKLRVEMANEFDRLVEAAQIDNYLAGTSQPGAAARNALPPTRNAPKLR